MDNITAVQQGKILLPPNALAGVRLGISVSESPDLARLGLLEAHFRLSLGEIARCALVSGGGLAYGGHLRAGGYTAFLVRELERYSRRDRPLRVYLAWSEHRQMSLSGLTAERTRLGLYGEIVCLDVDGNVIDPAANRNEAAGPPIDDVIRQRSLSGLRRRMVQEIQGRVLIGGRRAGFQGDMPGVLEEAVLSVEAGQPVFLAGGFGGITFDITKAIGVNSGDWFPPVKEGQPVDERVERGLGRLVDAFKRTNGKSLQNGLNEVENRRLAACHRPSEIAALVSLGLGRRWLKT